jgi:vancomycin resistance protein YoaR
MEWNEVESWKGEEETWTYHGEAIVPPATLRTEADDERVLPAGFARSVRVAWDRGAIERALRKEVLPVLDRDAEAVLIRRSATGAIVFDGTGMPGRHVRIDDAVDLTIAAIEGEIPDIELPMETMEPTITVEDPELRAQGIVELVAIGESDYRGSPVNRIHNIGVGLRRFNGHLIPQGTTFSFNEVLGPVDASAGYRKELTIIGDKTLPDYGGGLCQVSTTAYRGVWEYGFPIEQRRNHSYSVRYYGPKGTDATIYPPSVDIQFLNDSPGALLIQTASRDGRAYFLYYGTRDDRQTELSGPYIWDTSPAPPPRTEYTTELAPGETKKVGEAVPGAKVAWFRVVTTDAGEIEESFYSNYEARPLYHQIGVEAAALPVEPLDVPLPEAASSSSAMRAPASPKARFPVVLPRRRRE